MEIKELAIASKNNTQCKKGGERVHRIALQASQVTVSYNIDNDKSMGE